MILFFSVKETDNPTDNPGKRRKKRKKMSQRSAFAFVNLYRRLDQGRLFKREREAMWPFYVGMLGATYLMHSAFVSSPPGNFQNWNF